MGASSNNKPDGTKARTKRVEFAVARAIDLGKAIAAVRKDSELTQAEAAAQAGLSPSYLSKIENGRTSSILVHQIRALRRLGANITVTWDTTLPPTDSTAETADG